MKFSYSAIFLQCNLLTMKFSYNEILLQWKFLTMESFCNEILLHRKYLTMQFCTFYNVNFLTPQIILIKKFWFLLLKNNIVTKYAFSLLNLQILLLKISLWESIFDLKLLFYPGKLFPALPCSTCRLATRSWPRLSTASETPNCISHDNSESGSAASSTKSHSSVQANIWSKSSLLPSETDKIVFPIKNWGSWSGASLTWTRVVKMMYPGYAKIFKNWDFYILKTLRFSIKLYQKKYYKT